MKCSISNHTPRYLLKSDLNQELEPLIESVHMCETRCVCSPLRFGKAMQVSHIRLRVTLIGFRLTEGGHLRLRSSAGYVRPLRQVTPHCSYLCKRIKKPLPATNAGDGGSASRPRLFHGRLCFLFCTSSLSSQSLQIYFFLLPLAIPSFKCHPRPSSSSLLRKHQNGTLSRQYMDTNTTPKTSIY
jgi:hypothetical protein